MKLKKKSPISSLLSRETSDLSCSPLLDAAGLLRLSVQSRAGELPQGEFPLKNVSEIRLGKDGALEIKFFDRSSLLPSLWTASGGNADNPLLHAIEQGVKALKTADERSSL